MKYEYTRIIEGCPKKMARIVTKRISDIEYEIVKFEIPTSHTEIGEELLKEITADADKDGITLKVDVDNILPEK